MRTHLRLAAIVIVATFLGVAALLIVNGCSTGRVGAMATRSRAMMDPSRTGSGTANGLLAFSNDRTRHARAAAAAGSLPALDEEVWVIVKPDKSAAAPAPAPAGDDSVPGCGALMCRTPGGEPQAPPKDVALPLKHTEVHSRIDAYIASVEVTQQFHNPYESKIEAVYVFPLPENAAINGFVMTIGERKIRGIIREREEAQQIYNEAKSQGYVAALLTQERPNIFAQHVANIEPLKQVDVNITYFHTLGYDDGWYEFVFPMVVGPRFNPPHISDGIGAVARGEGGRGASGQKTEVQYLAPHERSGHDIGLSVDIYAGVSIEEIVCRSHKVQIENERSEQVRVTLDDADRIPNKDFVLRYRVAGERVKTGLLVHRDSSGGGEGYFTFMLFPPQQMSDEQRRPMEMIFVIDCSGSMNGQPIAQARAAIDHALTQLKPEDTFQIVRFSNSASQFGPNPVPATPDNVKRGRKYVSELKVEGGTMMIEGIKAALEFPHDPERLRFVTFLTDGYIGNESEILAAVHERLDESRIFSFGVGSAPNRYLMEAMAKMGRGAVTYLSLKDSGKDVMNAFFTRVSHPVLSDIAIDWGKMQVSGAMPERVPDLFVGRPVVVTGKFTGAPSSSIRITGRAGAQTVQATLPVDGDGGEVGEHPALAAVWARMHIAALMDRATWDGSNIELPQMVKELALRHGLMSAYTSFIAVDSSQRTAGDHGTTVMTPVPVPEGVRYDTTVPQ
jgi:Ca-activated chloride channel family protein